MSWKDDLPEEIRDAPALKDIPDVATLAKSLVDTQVHLGNSMKLPKDDWSAEELAEWDKRILDRAGGRLIPVPDVTDQEQADAFFRPLGKPENPDGYTAPEELDLSVIPEAQLKRFRDQVHNANLTDAQQQILLAHLAGDMTALSQGQSQAIEDTVNRLQTEWGTNTDAKRNELVNKLLNVQAPTSVVEMIRENKAGADATLFLDKILGQIGTEGHEVGGQVGGAGVETPAGLDAQISENEIRIASIMGQEKTVATRKQVEALTAKNVELRLKRDKLKA